jgi:tripartite-type tricarboxylate transporter receptor subunit TctC
MLAGCRGLLGAAGVLAMPRLASAQAWSTRPITLVIPFAAGGASAARPGVSYDPGVGT